MNKFNDIEYAPLRNYNRCVMLFNIREDSGYDAAAKYMEGFSDEEKRDMLDVYNRVKLYGVDAVKSELIRTMPLPEEEVA